MTSTYRILRLVLVYFLLLKDLSHGFQTPCRLAERRLVRCWASKDSEDAPFNKVKADFFPIGRSMDREELSPLFIDEDSEEPAPFNQEKFLEYLIPAAAPFIAFATYEWVATSFQASIDFLADITSEKNWVAVDGGTLQATLMVPVTNGVVLPAVAVLFATLTSTTISTLRSRQVDVLRALNKEAGELRVLESLVSAFPEGELQDRCRNYLIQYASRIISESQPDVGRGDNGFQAIAQRGMDSELNGFLQQMNARAPELPQHLIDESFASIARLREQRYDRLTALQITYPWLHYAILASLALAECTGFMVEANQDVNIFLNAIQLKVLWSMLVGTFVACFTVFYDLRFPFSGSYQISPMVAQLYTVRLALQAPPTLLTKESSPKENEEADESPLMIARVNGDN